jgi:hypothetical protein
VEFLRFKPQIVKNFVVGNFTGDMNKIHPPISKFTFDILLWVSGAESLPGT